MRYIVIDEDYRIVANGYSNDEDWVRHDAGGFHTKKEFDALYGEGQWEVDFSELYSGGVVLSEHALHTPKVQDDINISDETVIER